MSSGPVIERFILWDRMPERVRKKWKYCEVKPPIDCDDLEICDDADALDDNETETDSTTRRLLQTIPDVDVDDEPFESADLLCNPSRTHISCTEGIMLWIDPNVSETRHMATYLREYYSLLSASEGHVSIRLEDGSPLTVFSPLEDFQFWIESAALSDNFSCQSILYPLTRACCPGHYCADSEACMRVCDVRGGYCPSADSESPNKTGCVGTGKGLYQGFLGCGGCYEPYGECPEGRYCHNTTHATKCAVGYYCPSGYTHQVSCAWFQRCDNEGRVLPGVETLFLILIGALALFGFVLLWRERVVRFVMTHLMEWLSTEGSPNLLTEGQTEVIRLFLTQKRHSTDEDDLEFSIHTNMNTTPMGALSMATMPPMTPISMNPLTTVESDGVRYEVYGSKRTRLYEMLHKANARLELAQTAHRLKKAQKSGDLSMTGLPSHQRAISQLLVAKPELYRQPSLDPRVARRMITDALASANATLSAENSELGTTKPQHESHGFGGSGQPLQSSAFGFPRRPQLETDKISEAPIGHWAAIGRKEMEHATEYKGSDEQSLDSPPSIGRTEAGAKKSIEHLTTTSQPLGDELHRAGGGSFVEDLLCSPPRIFVGGGATITVSMTEELRYEDAAMAGRCPSRQRDGYRPEFSGSHASALMSPIPPMAIGSTLSPPNAMNGGLGVDIGASKLRKQKTEDKLLFDLFQVPYEHDRDGNLTLFDLDSKLGRMPSVPEENEEESGSEEKREEDDFVARIELEQVAKLRKSVAEKVHGVAERRKSLRRSEKLRAMFCMDIGFKELSLHLKGCGLCVVRPLSGCVSHGTVTGVMGVSGSGKTSFLFALSGKSRSYAQRTGDVVVNGRTLENGDILDVYGDATGFVPQSNIMSPHLTVRETLRFHSTLRSGEADVEAVVSEAMATLGLTRVADTLVVGDASKRGVSGGQKKRVSIGMEMVATPRVLFLDEPTTGLDATNAMQVMDGLRSLADEKGVNVIVVMHQPRFEIFMQFDDLLLLAKDGGAVYCGPTADAVPYFAEELGQWPAANMNPADFLLDMICGSGEQLFEKWCDNQPPAEELFCGDQNENATKYVHKRMPSILTQTLLVLKRRLLETYTRTIRVFISQALVCAFAGVVVGFISDYSHIGKAPTASFGVVIVVGVLAMNSSLKDYGSERLVYYREASSGLSRVAYWMGSNLCFSISAVILPFIFVCFYFCVGMPRGTLLTYTALLVVYWFAMQSVGHLISICVRPQRTTVVGGAVTVLWTITSGYEPPLITLPLAVTELNPCRWALEMLWVNETNFWSDVWEKLRWKQMDRFGWEQQLQTDIIALLVIGGVLRFAGLFALYYVNRDKQI